MIIVASPSITHIASLYAVLLGIDGEDFTVFIKRKIITSDSVGYCYSLPDNEIYIELDSRDKEIYKTLAHEMVHAKQLICGDLVDENGLTYWKGKLHKSKNTVTDEEYVNLPWEIEAHELEDALYATIRRQ